jgi:chemotaxis protein histidine kinase CheA
VYRRAAQFFMLLALLGVIDGSQPVMARQGQHHRQRDEDSQDSNKANAEKAPTGPVFAVVSLADQHVSFYEGSQLWARSRVSTGMNGHPTPTGIFNILEKERWHRSNIYSGAPMPFMQRVTWTGVALHAGVVPGYPASHGCIRLPADFAQRLFSATKVGQRVIISPHDIVPVAIEHAHFPAPKLQPAPGEPAPATSAAAQPAAATQTEQVALKKPDLTLLNPIEYAQAMNKDAAAKASAASKAKKTAEALLESLEDERGVERELNAAEASSREAQRDLDAANRVASAAQGDEAVKKAADKKAAAEQKLAHAEDKLRQARDAKAAREREIQAAKNAINDAETATQAAAAAMKQAARRLEPVSIFISRKTGRVYVRQGFQSLFDVPVTIREPERPLGTHLFVASEAGQNNASLRWVALTVPAAIEVKARPHSGRRGRRIEPIEDDAMATIPPFPESASTALDRIEIPEEAAQRISELLWTGATLIISDVGMSGEGRFAMDFQILSRTRVRPE